MPLLLKKKPSLLITMIKRDYKAPSLTQKDKRLDQKLNYKNYKNVSLPKQESLMPLLPRETETRNYQMMPPPYVALLIRNTLLLPLPERKNQISLLPSEKELKLDSDKSPPEFRKEVNRIPLNTRTNMPMKNQSSRLALLLKNFD